ncbi:MAG: hypothetical protein ACTSU5_14740 [Promethearchaeota archaeon]
MKFTLAGGDDSPFTVDLDGQTVVGEIPGYEVRESYEVPGDEVTDAGAERPATRRVRVARRGEPGYVEGFLEDLQRRGLFVVPYDPVFTHASEHRGEPPVGGGTNESGVFPARRGTRGTAKAGDRHAARREGTVSPVVERGSAAKVYDALLGYFPRYLTLEEVSTAAGVSREVARRSLEALEGARLALRRAEGWGARLSARAPGGLQGLPPEEPERGATWNDAGAPTLFYCLGRPVDGFAWVARDGVPLAGPGITAGGGGDGQLEARYRPDFDPALVAGGFELAARVTTRPSVGVPDFEAAIVFMKGGREVAVACELELIGAIDARVLGELEAGGIPREVVLGGRGAGTPGRPSPGEAFESLRSLVEGFARAGPSNLLVDSYHSEILNPLVLPTGFDATMHGRIAEAVRLIDADAGRKFATRVLKGLARTVPPSWLGERLGELSGLYGVPVSEEDISSKLIATTPLAPINREDVKKQIRKLLEEAKEFSDNLDNKGALYKVLAARDIAKKATFGGSDEEIESLAKTVRVKYNKQNEITFSMAKYLREHHNDARGFINEFGLHFFNPMSPSDRKILTTITREWLGGQIPRGDAATAKQELRGILAEECILRPMIAWARANGFHVQDPVEGSHFEVVVGNDPKTGTQRTLELVFWPEPRGEGIQFDLRSAHGYDVTTAQKDHNVLEKFDIKGGFGRGYQQFLAFFGVILLSRGFSDKRKVKKFRDGIPGANKRVGRYSNRNASDLKVDVVHWKDLPSFLKEKYRGVVEGRGLVYRAFELPPFLDHFVGHYISVRRREGAAELFKSFARILTAFRRAYLAPKGAGGGRG